MTHRQGRDKDIETYCRFLRDLGKLEIPVASYDFHPGNTYTTNMVQRRGYTAREFDLNDFRNKVEKQMFEREYSADDMSAQFTRNPLALASALEKIESAAAPTESIKRGAAHLCIADPLGRRLTNHEGWLADTFATHPPMGMRISRLKGMGYAQLKKEGGSSTSFAPA